MSTIDETVIELRDNPRPVLLLDTCDILNAMEGLSEKNARGLQWTTRLLEALASNSLAVQPIISYLVVHEWEQSLEKIKFKVVKFLNDIDESLQEVYEAFRLAKQAPPDSVPPRAPSYAETPIAAHLVGRMQAVIDVSAKLDKEAGCIESALRRVMERRRPSHHGMIKDTIILEHYLVLVHRLRDSGFTERCLFVSANKTDYWTNKTDSTLHPELRVDFDPAMNLEFFGNPIEALASFGL